MGLASYAAVLAGLALLVSGPLDGVRASYAQHALAARNDAGMARYGQALGAAYDLVADDAQIGLVSFEFGALPTTVDGRVLAPSAATAPRLLRRTDGTAPPASAPAARPADAAAAEPRTVEALPRTTDTSPSAPVRPTGSFPGGFIRIPAIGLDQPVVAGVSREDLRIGPGHYPGTALPGQRGNAVISGHRTTYTRPFHDLDRLVPGDEVVVDTPAGSHRYVVTEIVVVSADDHEVLRDTTDARLTLTTCHPKGSARSRLVVIARLV